MSRLAGFLPNALLVARREYLDRVRSRAFVVSTAILVAVAIAVALVPIGLRAVDRGTVTTIAVYADEPALVSATVGVLELVLNAPPAGQPRERWEKPFRIVARSDRDAALEEVRRRELHGLLVVSRRADGGLDFDYHTTDVSTSVRTQQVGFAALSAGVLDWSSRLREIPGVSGFRPPTYEAVTESFATEAGRPLDAQLQASRLLVATLFVVLIFITLIIYGMWVASSVASEKGSRVMELLISAATPRQLLVGKVVGVGAAGLTQYVAILVPAATVVFLQGRIERFVLGADASGAPLAGLTLPILLAYGLFFLLGFLLYALLYAAAGSLVSRLEDVQQLAMPMSFVSVAGYLIAVLGLNAINQPIVVAASFVPFFSPFVMLARLIVGRVEPWELGLSIGLLVATVGLAVWFAARVYSAGVLLYGQRPGLRAFVRAAFAGR
ncbi:MAG TPA: ABC transporter permease [Candidatus Limnocylindrales bacterium]|nr:ABC transporter permease [Candidatus Limnocylindrales bacterium]